MPGRRARCAGAAAIWLLACACGPDDVASAARGRADRDLGPAPLHVCFAGAASAGGGAVALRWDFGDGSARSAGALACHTYAEPGSYAASLEATAAAGDTALSVVIVTASAP